MNKAEKEFREELANLLGEFYYDKFDCEECEFEDFERGLIVKVPSDVYSKRWVFRKFKITIVQV